METRHTVFVHATSALHSQVHIMDLRLIHILFGTSLLVLTQACPNGWLTHGEHCYYFSTTTGTWGLVGSICRNFYAKLAEAVSEDQRNFLHDTVLTKHAAQGEYYLGGADYFMEGKWLWTSTKQPIASTGPRWSPGEPNNDNGKEDCLALKTNGLWNDVPCNTSLPFICQMENDDPGEIIGK